MSKRVVSIQVSGQEYRIRSDADEAALRRVAELVDAAMGQIRARTGTVDSLDVAILTSLNLGRELLSLRERVRQSSGEGADSARLRGLIELAESALVGERRGEQTPLLTVPAGLELEEPETELADPTFARAGGMAEAAPR